MPMMRIAILAGLTMVILGLTHGSAHADPIKLDYAFTASQFVRAIDGAPVIAPVDPVTGAFSLTFDNAGSLFNQTSITLTKLNISLGSPAGFSYDSALDRLVLGGLAIGADALQQGTDDFVMAIQHASTTPVFAGFHYSQVGTDLFSSTVETLTPTPSAPVPEPTSLSLLALGVASLGARRWYRR